MTRPVVSLRKIALIMAGGSFLAGTATAVHADEPAPPAPATVAGAARLNIAPLRLEFDAKKSSGTLMLTNTSDRVVPVQARLFAWSQQGGEDQFAPSNALTISPAIIAIAPGATQIVRLLRNGTPSPGEKRFRLTVDQLPDPTMAQSGQAEARLRFAIPVFLDRDTAAPAQLSWKVGPDRLELANAGGATSRIIALEVKTASGQPVALERNSLRYVLGGAAIAWPLKAGCPSGPVTITARVDDQTANVQATPTCG